MCYGDVYNYWPFFLFMSVSQWGCASGEGVVQRNGCPKGRFWRVRFFSAPLRFALKTPANLKGQRRNRLSKSTLLTTVSPHDAFSAPLALSDKSLFIGHPFSWAGRFLRGRNGPVRQSGKRPIKGGKQLITVCNKMISNLIQKIKVGIGNGNSHRNTFMKHLKSVTVIP